MDQLVADLVSMATLPISLTAAAIATTFDAKADQSPSSYTTSSTLSFVDLDFKDVEDNQVSYNSVTLSTSTTHRRASTSLPLSPFPVPPEEGLPHSELVGDAVLNSIGTLRESSLMLGEVLIGLRLDVDRHLLSVVVVHYKGIHPTIYKQGNKDWYVKLYLKVCNRPDAVKKRRTSIQRAMIDPSFNEIFHFHSGVLLTMLEVVLCIRTSRFHKDKVLGRTRISLDGLKDIQNPKGEEHFQYYPLMSDKGDCSLWKVDRRKSYPNVAGTVSDEA